MGGMMIWMLISGLLGVAVLVLAAFGIYWLVRRFEEDRRGGAERELRRRYAAGEIDAEDYRQRLDDLRR